MSAIFGLLQFDGGKIKPGDLERMGNVLAHRGPDGRRTAVHGAAGLGHCLMRVNKEDLFEAQPLYDRDADATLVADLRIDNREELADAFGIDSVRLRELPDSALVMRAYKLWGEDCAAHLLGDFAFAIWDGCAKKLYLARDHMGQRYFHYHISENFFAFATELKALWALPEVPRQLSETALARGLVFQRASRDNTTFFENIRLPAGGSTVTVRGSGDLTVSRYWEPEAGEAHIGRDEPYYIEAYRRILKEAVECRIRRLIAPPALLLSAGYDSGAIAGLSGPLLTAQGRKLITVSSALPEDYEGPLTSVRRWVELCRRDMPHLDVKYFVRKDETLFTNLDQTCLAADAPPLGLHYMTDALFRVAAGAGARLVMDGIGGDDTINPRVSNMLAQFLRAGKYRLFFHEFAAGMRVAGVSFRNLLRNAVLLPLAPLWVKRTVRAIRLGSRLTWCDRLISPEFAERMIKAGALDTANLMLTPERYLSPRDLMLRSLQNWAAKSRRNDSNEAAAHGLELTRPFRDKRIVELGLALPECLYIKNGRRRYLGCRALADVYPAEFQTREARQDVIEPDHKGMLVAALPKLKAEFGRMRGNSALRKYLNFEAIEKALNRVHDEPPYSPNLIILQRTFYFAKFVEWVRRDN